VDNNKFGDRQPWGEYAKTWVRDWAEEKAYPRGEGESNVFLSTLSGTCAKDYIKTGSKTLKGVDLGCNYGGMIHHFESAGFDYTGIDQSRDAIDLAIKKFPDKKWICSLFWDLNINEEFDIAYIQAVLQHNLWAEQERIVPKIFAMLKPGGVFYFTEGTIMPSEEGPVMNCRTSRGWIDLMVRNGFNFEKKWSYGGGEPHNLYLVTKPIK
jgi:SAM-dependent methyltransferase